MRADNPKFIVADPGGFAERNFRYPLLRSSANQNEVEQRRYPRVLFAMAQSEIANNV